jgi:adenylate kinase family enzyme
MSPKPSRIVIVGISGTGKSAFARRVAAVTGLPVFHVDSILWGENWTELPRPNVELELNRIARFGCMLQFFMR